MMTAPGNLARADARRLREVLDLCPHLNETQFPVAQFVRTIMNRTSENPHPVDGRRRSTRPSRPEELRQRPVSGPGRGLRSHDLTYSNGPTEGMNTKIKLLKRQMYGRAGFPLLRQRILLN